MSSDVLPGLECRVCVYGFMVQGFLFCLGFKGLGV